MDSGHLSNSTVNSKAIRVPLGDRTNRLVSKTTKPIKNGNFENNFGIVTKPVSVPKLSKSVELLNDSHRSFPIGGNHGDSKQSPNSTLCFSRTSDNIIGATNSAANSTTNSAINSDTNSDTKSHNNSDKINMLLSELDLLIDQFSTPTTPTATIKAPSILPATIPPPFAPLLEESSSANKTDILSNASLTPSPYVSDQVQVEVDWAEDGTPIMTVPLAKPIHPDELYPQAKEVSFTSSSQITLLQNQVATLRRALKLTLDENKKLYAILVPLLQPNQHSSPSPTSEHVDLLVSLYKAHYRTLIMPLFY